MSLIRPDYNLPIFHKGKNRKEILLIEYDGFIKNKVEGIVQTMLKDKEKWIVKYPNLVSFYTMSRDDLFESTSLFNPIPFMRWLSDERLEDSEIESDIIKIEQMIDIDEQCITMFEYSLYRLLSDDIITRCFIIKETKFHDNEIAYLEKSYGDTFSKITLVNGGLLTIFEKENPTTIFLNDTSLLLGHIILKYTDEQLKSKMFILRNSSDNIDLLEEGISYRYNDIINKLNSRQIYGISRMFTFQADDLSSDDE